MEDGWCSDVASLELLVGVDSILKQFLNLKQIRTLICRYADSKYPMGPLGYKLYSKIEGNKSSDIFRATVCEISWKAFAEGAKDLPVETLKKIENSGFREAPWKLLDLRREDVSEMTGETRWSLVQDVLNAVKNSRIETEEFVAVKISDVEVSQCPKRTDPLVSVQHPNVLEIHSAFNVEETEESWIVMPFVAGGSCKDMLRSTHPHGIKDTGSLASILDNVLRAIVHLHEQGIAHKDLRAANILLAATGTVKLGTFWLTSLRGESANDRFSNANLPWCAPEVAKQRADDLSHAICEKAADIWSFGITAMELAYGSTPLKKEDEMDSIVKKLLETPPPTPREYQDYGNPPFPESFDSLVSQCLNRDPMARPDAKELLSHPFLSEHRKGSGYIARNVILNILGEKKRALVQERERRRTVELQKRHSAELLRRHSAQTLTMKLQRAPRSKEKVAKIPQRSATPGACTRRVGRFTVRGSLPPMRNLTLPLPMFKAAKSLPPFSDHRGRQGGSHADTVPATANDYRHHHHVDEEAKSKEMNHSNLFVPDPTVRHVGRFTVRTQRSLTH
uniref:Protein kinase domain-containing protein n=1 Tax=Lotharella oceanica TaxID=641309 RepID=A0A7S2XBC6_9EUKA|mmetsp:Transcript_25708/g.47999  ORF Transcript_25708/g.47999 Transcript_25708/m.47999 type:complete len:564 (+) Transcript_25708:145-1836(+)|eukprot:CAMPEP_0170196292 /NCGR_PEP_ID=MMETSP0040_2-20121228/63528_1 /TAXON_ID=641309 /ORGANISM="Lotharella oceanica, Strain CCMP622" /LENGTH=563 /DNA_ID=CAMNT_0010445665 /DNA_START=103 /DNA_END=1794 /DNA_ORIENTATION=+